MKTLIAVPCTETLEVAFASCLLRLQRVGDMEVMLLPNSLVYDARNNLARYAIANKFDYVLWIDSDMTFDADLAVRMFESLGDKHYLSALCFGRRPPFRPCIYKKLEMTEEELGPHPHAEVYEDYPRDSLFEIAGSGYGCVLQSVEMLDVMQGVYGHAFFPYQGFGEDLTFCYRAQAIDYKMYCDSSIKVGHIMNTIIDESFRDRLPTSAKAD